MKFWQSLANTETEQMIEIAQIADRVGIHGILLSDHLFCPEKFESKYPYSSDGTPPFDAETHWPDPWVTIGAMAAVTKKLLFSTNIYILPLRNPIAVAKQIGTAAVLSNNRVSLGAGAGWMKEEFTLMNENFETRGERYDECIEIMRKLWRGGMVEHHGKHYDFDKIQMSPAPKQPIPIWLGGQTSVALKRAARLGDGWIGTYYSPEDTATYVKKLAQLRKDFGREKAVFEITLALTSPLSADLCKRIEDVGVTSLVLWPPFYALRGPSTIDQKRKLMESIANDVIAKL